MIDFGYLPNKAILEIREKLARLEEPSSHCHNIKHGIILKIDAQITEYISTQCEGYFYKFGKDWHQFRFARNNERWSDIYDELFWGEETLSLIFEGELLVINDLRKFFEGASHHYQQNYFGLTIQELWEFAKIWLI